MAGVHIGPSPSSRFAAPALRCGRCAMTAPFRCGVFVSMIFAERSRPAGPACAAKIMETKSLSRAQGSMFASVARNPRSGLDIDAEHGSGRADREDFELRCVNPIAAPGAKDHGTIFDPNIVFRKNENHATLVVIALRHTRLAGTGGPGLWEGQFNLARHARPCAGHPRRGEHPRRVDGRVKPGHDGEDVRN